MILLARTSDDWPYRVRRSRWSLWRFNRRDITPERKIDHALLEVDGPAPSTGWLWLPFAAALAWIVVENL